MAKATKKSQDPAQTIKASTSTAKPKKAKTRRESQNKTAGKKDGEPSSRNCVMVQVTTKVKKTRPRSPKRKASKKTTSARKTKKVTKKSLFGHYHHLMEEMASTETEPGQSSVGSCSVATSDLESQ